MKQLFFTLLFLTSLSSADPLTFDYISRDSGPLQIDLHIPADSEKTLHPVILWIHGGGWKRGSRENMNLVAWLNDHGFAIASIDYRLTHIAPFPAQLDDCRAALKWVRENGHQHGLDSSRVIVSGLSAGAHLATLLSVSPPEEISPVQAVIHFYGPSDFVQMSRYAKKPTDPLNLPDSNVYRLLGGPLMNHLELAKQASPVNYLDETDPPCLIIVGDQDSLMTQRQCARLHQAALAAGVASELHVIPGARHGGRAFSDSNRQKLILNFLKNSLP